MAIKDQCEKCRFKEENGCSKLVPSFDGTSCDVYAKRINLEKEKEELHETTPINSDTQNENPNLGDNYHGYAEDIPSDESIHGWLLFFLSVFVGIGSIWSIGELFTLNLGNEESWLALFTVVIVLGFVTTGIFTIIAFKRRDSDAVLLAKTYIILRFIFSISAIFSDDLTSRETSQAISSTIWSIIWYIFLFCSTQIKRQIPIRKSKTRDWILIGAIILLPLICLGVGIAKENETHSNTEAAALANLTLSQNQFTDGRIVLTIPSGVDCEETLAENTKVFSVSDPETGAEVTVVSDYDNDMSKKNFNQYWRGWKSDELNSLEYDVVKDDKQSNDDVTVFYKLIRIKVEDPVDWEFALVFDHKTGKVCLVSGYSSAQGNSPVAYIINNLNFL